MTANSNGETSYLILSSLEQGSKYGLEIIEYISDKTGGNLIMKKPTLYSCLTRLEKKGLISSSYWGESEMGGKRHYYNITTDGKKELDKLSQEFSDAKFSSNKENDIQNQELQENSVQDKAPVLLQQDNIFNLVQENTSTKQEKEEKIEDKSDVVDNQIDFFSFQAEQAQHDSNQEIPYQSQKLENEEIFAENAENVENQEFYEENITNETTEKISSQKNLQEETSAEFSQGAVEKMEYYQSILEQTPPKDNSRFLGEDERLTPDQEEQNKRLYDTSSELKKYRKRKSFSENQIEMSVVYESEDDQEIQRARIEELKASMLRARQNNFSSDIGNVENSNYNFKTTTENTSSVSNFSTFGLSQEEKLSQNDSFDSDVKNLDIDKADDNAVDDAVFITSRIQESEIPIQKKITPPNIEIDVTDGNLPAPKRNSALEPTYKDMMAKLFERKKETESQRQKEQSQQQLSQQQEESVSNFADYGSLKKYYQSHDIEFKEYSKSNVQRRHNTNLLNFISSVALLLFAGVGSAILFGIICGVNKLSASTTWMFYTVPILFLIYAVYAFIRDKVYLSKKAILTYNSVVNWAVWLLASIVVLVINVIAGMQYETMADYLTSLLVPIYALLLAFPINYYIKKFLYKKYAK